MKTHFKQSFPERHFENRSIATLRSDKDTPVILNLCRYEQYKYDVCNLFYSLSYKGLPMKKATLVIGVIGADCHAVGNKVLDRVLATMTSELLIWA